MPRLYGKKGQISTAATAQSLKKKFGMECWKIKFELPCKCANIFFQFLFLSSIDSAAGAGSEMDMIGHSTNLA